MKKLMMILFIFALLLTGCSEAKTSDKVKIGVIQWAEHPALDDALTGFKNGLNDLGLSDQVELVVKNANDDASNANMMVDQLLGDKVSLIYAIATPAAQAAMAGADTLGVPVIFNAVTDAVSAGLVESNEMPGGVVTGVSDLAPLDAQLALIKEFLPQAQNIGVLYNTGEDNSLHLIETLEDKVGSHELTLLTQGVSSAQEIEFATQSLASKVDAFYIITDNLIAKATSQVVGVANENKIPVFMAEAGQFEYGILASDSISYLKLGQEAASMAHEILFNNVNPAEIPVVSGGATDLLVSQTVAEFLGLEIPESVLERAIVK